MRRIIGMLVGGLVAALLVSAPSAQAVISGHEGCTPGYWKNHTDNWQEASPGDAVSSLYVDARSNVAGLTLLEALQGGGGPGADGAAVILARASVAAWLNAAHEGVGYPWRRDRVGEDGRPPLVATVNAAFRTGDRDTMLDLARRLDRDNNLGCTLS